MLRVDGEPPQNRGWAASLAAAAGRWIDRLGPVLAAAGATVLLLEAVVRLSGIDRPLIARALYLQVTDVPVHRISADPFLHYELAPNARSDGGQHTVTIDAFGARHPTHPKDKPHGVVRILCFGGSTMYGAGVDDGQTIPAALEARLNAAARDAAAPRGFEAWNFGTSAYTLGQAAHLARTKLDELDPDLILVQHHNVGRRPYLGTREWRLVAEPPELAHPDVDFLLEQLPAPRWIAIDLQRDALSHSAAYRALLAAITPLVETRGDWHCDRCDAISAGEARALSREGEGRGVPVVFIAIPADHGVTPDAIFPELPADRFVDLHRPGRKPNFYEVHPPPAMLDEYARILADALRERGLLGARDATGRGSAPTSSRAPRR